MLIWLVRIRLVSRYGCAYLWSMAPYMQRIHPIQVHAMQPHGSPYDLGTIYSLQQQQWKKRIKFRLLSIKLEMKRRCDTYTRCGERYTNVRFARRNRRMQHRWFYGSWYRVPNYFPIQSLYLHAEQKYFFTNLSTLQFRIAVVIKMYLAWDDTIAFHRYGMDHVTRFVANS